MLLRTLTLSLFLTLFSITSSHAAKVAGLTVPDTLEHAGTTLSLNGAGIRKRVVISVYVGALYLGSPSQDAAAIIQADEPMAIRLQVKSGFLSRDKMKAALKSGFKKATKGNTAPIQAEIDQMLELMSDKISKRDIYVLAYDPAKGTTMSKNGNDVGVVAGLPFKQALFGIWLSESPVQLALKKRMLGL